MEVQNFFSLQWKYMRSGKVKPWEKLPLLLSLSLQKCVSFPFLAHPFSDESSCQFLLFLSCFSTHERPYLDDWGQVESRRLPGLTWPALSLFCSHPAPFLLPFFPCPLLNLPAWSSSRWWLGAWQLARAGSSGEGPVQPFASRQPVLSLLERATLPGWPAWLKCEEGDCVPHFELNSFRFARCPEHPLLLTVDGSGFVLLMTVCKNKGDDKSPQQPLAAWVTGKGLTSFMGQRLLCEPAELNRLLAGLPDWDFTNFKQISQCEFPAYLKHCPGQQELGRQAQHGRAQHAL